MQWQAELGGLVGGASAAARHLPRSVPMGRLLLALATRHGAAMGHEALRQLAEAAASTQTSMSKAVAAKVSELMAAGS